jgi:transcriptional regulator
VRHNPIHAETDPDVVRELIAENPWATLVSEAGGRLVASHYPALLDDQSDELAVVTHVGRPDEQVHEFGAREVLMIFQGPHGYISPSWYTDVPARVPTWNFSVAHCYGTPQVLDADENLRVLTRLVAHFERRVEEPAYLDQEAGARIATGTVGLRIPVERFVCKVKMSADKDPGSRQRVLAELRGEGPYASPALAADMERALARRTPPDRG